MSQLYLTKSDFKVAQECKTKLYYRKLNYPSTKDTNEYLQLLSEGGFMVGKMAQLMFTDGVEIEEKDLEKAIARTQELLKKDKVTIFEAAFLSNHKAIRVDILVKNGFRIDIIEVKAKSFDGELGNAQFWNSRHGKIKADWQPYLEDITFQTIVLKELFPQYQINSFLLMPDKSKVCKTDGLAKFFKVSKKGLNKSVSVEFIGDLEVVKNEDFLVKVEVNSEVDLLLNEVSESANNFIEILKDGLHKVQ
ncbi:MAG: hypothetical protein SFU25_08025, partial [Candidatus Caenarcaniphilales bacterium]|nr:hypothetical protein [Candidatus Caenarcaniphilales bacterium]